MNTQKKFAKHNGREKNNVHGEGAYKKETLQLVPVSVWLERALDFHTNVVSLLLGECGELGAKRRQVQSCDLLIELLWQQVHLIFVALVLLPVLQKVQLAENLVCPC